MRLHVGVRGAEERLGARDCERLRDVDELAAAVVAASGVALGVLVGEHGALRFENGAGNEVLARDHLEGVALATELGVQNRRDLGVDLRQGRVELGRKGHQKLLGAERIELRYPFSPGVRPNR